MLIYSVRRLCPSHLLGITGLSLGHWCCSQLCWSGSGVRVWPAFSAFSCYLCNVFTSNSFLTQSSGFHWALSVLQFISPVSPVVMVLKESPGSLLISFITWLRKLLLNDIFVIKVIFTFFCWADIARLYFWLGRIHLSWVLWDFQENVCVSPNWGKFLDG